MQLCGRRKFWIAVIARALADHNDPEHHDPEYPGSEGFREVCDLAGLDHEKMQTAFDNCRLVKYEEILDYLIELTKTGHTL